MSNTKKRSTNTVSELDAKAAAQMFITTFELLAEKQLANIAVVRDKISGQILGIRIVLPVGVWELKDEKDLVFTDTVDGLPANS